MSRLEGSFSSMCVVRYAHKEPDKVFWVFAREKKKPNGCAKKINLRQNMLSQYLSFDRCTFCFCFCKRHGTLYAQYCTDGCCYSIVLEKKANKISSIQYN